MLEALQQPDHSASLSCSRETPASYAAEAKQDKRGFLEFFAGSGLVAEGFKEIFKPLWANDICPKKAEVYSANHGSAHFHLGSITHVRGASLPYAPLAWASFPCQDLSLAGLADGIHASRSGLVWEWLRVIDEMPRRPPILVAENVSGLVSLHGGLHYKKLHKALVQRGYYVGAMLLNAELWVPQSRPRVFVLAIAKTARLPSFLTSIGPNWLHTGAVIRAAEGLPDWIWWEMPHPPKRKITLNDIVEWDALPQDDETQRRNLALISPRHAKLLQALPSSKPFAVPGYKRTRNGSQVLELRFDSVAGCLRTPEGGSSRQLLILRKNGKLFCRLLTVRETARLMGAPDSYKLPGRYNDGYRAMGDGVAAPVAQWLAKHLLLPIVEANVY
jgi:DNA (cytosine-5)-methyltransferase 1